jgi:hypothetical protein
MAKKYYSILIALLLLPAVLAASPARAGEGGLFQEWGASIFAHQDLDLSGVKLNAVGMLVHVEGLLWKSQSLRLNLRLEGMVSGYGGYGQGSELALIPALRLYLFNSDWARPGFYVEGGVGPAYNDVNIPELGQEFNFVSFGGLGLRWPLGDGVSFQFGYRLRHISNAGMNGRNHGVTSNQLQAGFSWAF